MKDVSEMTAYEKIDTLRLELAYARRQGLPPTIICDIHDKLMTAYQELEVGNVATIIDRIDYKNAA